MGNVIKFTVLLVALCTHVNLWADGGKILARGPNWEPYIYKQDSQIKGYAYNIAKDVLEAAKVPHEFAVQPWARVYRDGQDIANFMIIGVGRTPKREKMFQWIGPIAKGSDIHFFKLRKNSIFVKNLEDIKSFKVGVERDSYYEDFVRINGFEGKNISLTADVLKIMKMLLHGRIDFVLMQQERIDLGVKEMGIAPETFEKALFGFNVTDYIAFSKQTSPTVVNKIKDAYQQLNKAGKIELR